MTSRNLGSRTAKSPGWEILAGRLGHLLVTASRSLCRSGSWYPPHTDEAGGYVCPEPEASVAKTWRMKRRCQGTSTARE